jgi:hypothetical protein
MTTLDDWKSLEQAGLLKRLPAHTKSDRATIAISNGGPATEMEGLNVPKHPRRS